MLEQAIAFINGRDLSTLTSRELRKLVDMLDIPIGKVTEPELITAIKTVLGPSADSKPE